MRYLRLAVLSISLVLVTGPAALAQTVYDDFKGKTLDRAKWFGDQLTLNGAMGLEIEREVSGGKLVMSHRVAGIPGGGSGFSYNRIFFRNPAPFTSVQADLKVAAVQAVDCTVGVTIASIKQFNFLFNTSDFSGGCVTPTCDIYAIFYLDHVVGDNGTLQVHGAMEARATDNSASFLIPPLVELGTLKVGKTATISTAWDEGLHLVTFQKKVGTDVQAGSVDYGVLGNNAVAGAFNTIEVGAFLPECAAGQAEARTKTTWDKIVVTP